MKDKTKQTEIQAHIFQKSSIIVECFPVLNCYNIAHAQTRHFSGSCSDIIDSKKRSVFFFYKLLNRRYVVPFFDLLYLLCWIKCGRGLQ